MTCNPHEPADFLNFDTSVGFIFFRFRYPKASALAFRMSSLWYSLPMPTESSFQAFWSEYVRAHSQPGTWGDSSRRYTCWLGPPSRCHRAAKMVVHCGGADCFLRAGVDFTFFCGAQPAGDLRTSAVVVVGGSKDGGIDVRRKNGRRGSPVRYPQNLTCSQLVIPSTARNPSSCGFGPATRNMCGMIHRLGKFFVGVRLQPYHIR
jgi:hypothetical protein